MPKPLQISAPQHTFTTRTALGGIPYVLVFQWNYRTSSWYLSIEDISAAEFLCVDRRISPGSILARFPDGSFLWPVGPDPYVQDDLGQALSLWAVGPDELDRANAPRDPDPVLL